MMFVCIARDSGGIRTHDPQLRRLLLYPAELRNHPSEHLCCKPILHKLRQYHRPRGGNKLRQYHQPRCGIIATIDAYALQK